MTTASRQQELFRSLSGGDRRSIGRAAAVLDRALADRGLVPALVNGLGHPDRLVRMRCADVLEKLSAVRPDWLADHRGCLLDLAGTATEIEMRWHLAQMLPRLSLRKQDRGRVVRLMLAYLKDNSRIVRTFALQALAELAAQEPSLRRKVLPLVRRAADSGSPAEQARARKLLPGLTPGGAWQRRRR